MLKSFSLIVSEAHLLENDVDNNEVEVFQCVCLCYLWFSSVRIWVSAQEPLKPNNCTSPIALDNLLWFTLLFCWKQLNSFFYSYFITKVISIRKKVLFPWHFLNVLSVFWIIHQIFVWESSLCLYFCHNLPGETGNVSLVILFIVQTDFSSNRALNNSLVLFRVIRKEICSISKNFLSH